MGLISRDSSRTYRKMIYPDLSIFFKNLSQTKTLSIATEDSLIDTHCQLLLCHLVDRYLDLNENIILKSYRFRTFEIVAFLTKAGLARVTNFIKDGKLTIFGVENDSFEKLENPIEEEPSKILILDGLTSILENSSNDESTALTITLNLILKSEKMFKTVLLKTEFSPEIKIEQNLINWLKKRSDIFIQTEPTSFVSTSVHGKILVGDMVEEV